MLKEDAMTCRECGDEVRELYSCRLCDVDGLCAVCANLCQDYGPDEELNDPLVKCRICRASRPISQMNTNGECAPCQREVALMVKPQGKCVEIEDHNGNTWKL